ncbi:MAG: uridine kinase [Firmicutes bacterium]|nr:uridine kinase [Bacillota bacterium]
MGMPFVVGIAGGTGSGKTSVAKAIADSIPEQSVILPQDAYYKANWDLPFEERAKQNYDHPDAFDTELFIQDILALKAGKTIQRPVYSFAEHIRLKETVTVEPKEIILVEGILIFAEERLRKLFDVKVYVDTDADVRILRRLMRDLKERGRSLDSVVDQYLTSVKPMHEAFVEPTKRFADIIIPEGAHNQVGMDILVARIKLGLEQG